MTLIEVRDALQSEIASNEKKLNETEFAAKFPKVVEKLPTRIANAKQTLEVIERWLANRPSPFAYMTKDEQAIVSMYRIDMTL